MNAHCPIIDVCAKIDMRNMRNSENMSKTMGYLLTCREGKTKRCREKH